MSTFLALINFAKFIIRYLSALSVDGNISTLDTITFAKRASQFGVPSPTIIDILNVISFSLESKFRFYT